MRKLKCLLWERDSDFEGFRVPVEAEEMNQNPLPGGRNIELNEVFNEVGQEIGSMFDRNVGDSSEEDE